MPRHAALNHADHRDLRVDTGHGAALGDDVMYATTFPSEFRELQAHYPIVFGKTAEGAFQPLALLGLREGENLFLQGDRWDAAYVPRMIRRQPFLIGTAGGELMLHVDLDHPRVRTDGSGTALFTEQGGTSAYLDEATSLLRSIHDGMQATPTFVAVLLEHGLLEPFTLEVALDDGSNLRLANFYAINEERLAQLDADAFAALGPAGHLEPIYMALASLANLRPLIERRNARVARD